MVLKQGPWRGGATAWAHCFIQSHAQEGAEASDKQVRRQTGTFGRLSGAQCLKFVRHDRHLVHGPRQRCHKMELCALCGTNGPRQDGDGSSSLSLPSLSRHVGWCHLSSRHGMFRLGERALRCLTLLAVHTCNITYLRLNDTP